MQPKFTLLKELFCMRFLPMAIVLLLSLQFSYAQKATNGARPQPTVTNKVTKPLTKEDMEKQQTAVFSGNSNDAGRPAPAKLLTNGIQTEAICTTYTGALTAADPTLTGGRFFRDGVPSTCAVPKPACPGTSGAAGNSYRTHTFTNSQAVPQCITVTVGTTDATFTSFVSAHLGSFDPTNVCTNYLADAGSSAGLGAPITFSFTLPGSATVVFAVTTLTPGVFAGNYSISVDGICTPCVPTNATAPVISSVPSSTCAGSPITLSILSGSLNGAANWVWYAGGCGTGASIGTGTSITVSPVANTTYFARGEGGCAPAPGPCGSQAVTVSACSCISPDVSTICAGSVQALRVNQTLPATVSAPFTAAGAITINASGNGSPYPATLAVAGLPGGATINSVTLTGLSHTFPADVDIALRSPSGQTVILLSDQGGATDAVNANLTFRDGSPAVPAVIVTGIYSPTNIGVPDNFPAPGPGSVSQATPLLSSISGSMNGTWELFVVDDLGGDAGSISGGFSITFNLPATTATWSPVTGLFTNPNGTGAYVAGTQTAVVYASPATTTTYTATVNNGPCVGANTVTVNVLPVSTVSVTPNGLPSGVCAQATLVATGASIYNWTPATGLNTTTGSTVIASPSVNTTYTVNGYSANGCPTAPVSVQVLGTSTSAVISSLGAPPTTIWNEGLDGVIPPAGWSIQNNSAPLGVTTWQQGSTTGVFPSQSGAGFASTNFNNTAGTGTISNWFFSPTTTMQNGDIFDFWARSINGGFPDRLQVRLSTSGASTNVGATATSTGDFGTLLLDINPTYNTTAFPNVWTRYTATVSGLPGPTSGRIAFRYFVENGGPAGANSDFIGVDNVSLLRPPLATCANTLSNIKVDISGGTGPYTLVYTNGTTNFIVNGYVSGTPIDVFPSATTTYTIVSVTGANGCVGIGNTGAAVITVTPPPSITTQPVNRTTCAGLNTSFTVAAGPSLGTTYQWQVSTNGGGTYTNIANAAPYSGATTNTLTITGATVGLNQNLYRVVVSGACPAPGSSVTSAAATLFVNVTPTIVTQPANTTRCLGTTATFTVVANTPNGPAASTYQWQVSTNNGLTYTNITGATAATLSLTNVALIQNNNLYRVVVTTAPCATTVTSNGARLNVNALPVITISSPLAELTPGVTTVITATTSPAALTSTSYSWTLNGVTVAGANTSTIPVDIDKLGAYRATVTDVNGCVNSSNVLVIGAQSSDRLWIYPNPSDGQFQVRLFYGSPTAEADSRVVSVYNSQGQLVARKNIDLRRTSPPYVQVTFDLSNQPAGTYVVKVTEKTTEKVVSGFLTIL
ncbi:hypothetical protein CAP36_14905 [Chitinophagaceae bacterium IBVUCB2]|nr:hypothetical protein CAP36_14905 [Chitinophagaceae bacterium IBVUCB2]